MDAAKLRNSCICGHSEPYVACCGPYAERKEGAPATIDLAGEFRHALHELHMHLFPLRMLYQQYWEKLSQDAYPHHILMEDGDYGRAVVENFFWDYSVQYSDARPILRTAREVEGRNLRLGHDLLQWSFAPMWPHYVVETDERDVHLRQVGHDKMHRVRNDGRLPPAGHGLWARLLPFRGQHFVGMARLATPAPVDPGHLDALLQSACKDLGLRTTVSLRPDVHCDEWRRHGALFLAQWRQMVYDAQVGRPARTLTAVPAIEIPLPPRGDWMLELSRQPQVRVIGEGRFELRHRGLALGRLEVRDTHVLVSLFDPVFTPPVERILAQAGLHLPWDGDVNASTPGDAAWERERPASDASLDAWMHIPHAALNGQTPIQASTHDFGRRRLRLLLDEMSRRGRDISDILKQLRM